MIENPSDNKFMLYTTRQGSFPNPNSGCGRTHKQITGCWLVTMCTE